MDFTQKVAQQVSKYAPQILTGVSVAGVIVTAIFAGKATLEAAEVVTRLDNATDETLTKKEILEVSWKFYIPTIIAGGLTAACIISTDRMHSHRYEALLGVYSITEIAFREYKDKVVERLGESKERKIHDEIMQDRLDAHPSTEVVIIGNGDVKCMESITGRYFMSDMEKIRKAENTINARLIHDMYVSHNEFCDLVGLPTTALGDQIGWTVDHMMECVFTGGLDEKGQPCLVVDYRISPKSDYYKLH